MPTKTKHIKRTPTADPICSRPQPLPLAQAAEDPVYDRVVALMEQNLHAVASRGRLLFTTNASPEQLWMRYLQAFPVASQQHHNCRTCRHFIERYGGLVTIDEQGNAFSLWPWHDVLVDGQKLYVQPIQRLASYVEAAKVTGVFYSADKVLGTPRSTNGWTHFALQNPQVFEHLTLSAEQAMAEKKQDYQQLCLALSEFKSGQVAQALQLLESEALHGAEKALGQARWLLERCQIHETEGEQRWNLLWDAVAKAPPGFCHPRASLLGSLLEDFKRGRSLDQIRESFNQKTRPENYQRPQAAPAAGTIVQAEKLAAQMNLEPSLHRRWATLADVKRGLVWQPKTGKAAPAGPVFGHLQTKAAPEKVKQIPTGQRITWVKFAATVLPQAEQIYYLVPPYLTKYVGITTATNQYSLPILQWDEPAQRNPVSVHAYKGDSSAAAFNLVVGDKIPVIGVMLFPHMWADENRYPHHSKGTVFLLEGCHDTRGHDSALFPANLRSELHGVRSVIEAFSKSRPIEGDARHAVAGILVPGCDEFSNTFEVVSRGMAQKYFIDRWD